jgi:two-component system sensor histidine kinase UhpB
MSLIKKPLSILVIEDNEGDFVLFETCLYQTQLNVENLYRAETIGAATSFKKKIDIVFLDLTLPDSSGAESFERFNEMFPNLPIVVLSGMSDKNIALECISLGAQDYLLKNEVTDTLLEKSIHYSLERKKNLEELRKINRQHELIGTITNDVIWNWNLATNEIMDAKKDFFGYGEHEVRKQPDWWIDKIHPADVDRINLAIRNILSGNAQSLQEEYRFRCADGTYRYVFSRGILIKEENSTNQMVGAMMDITEHKKLKNELLETHLRFQKQLTEATILGQEKEKEEIGKELHDNINQILASSSLYLDLAIKQEQMREELLPACKQNISLAIEEIRKLSHSLIPPSLGDQGLLDAVSELIADLNKTGLLKARLSIDNFDDDILTENKRLMLYRVIQEQINNTIKYAKATEVVVEFKIKADQLSLVIRDNGVGFDVTTRSNGVGFRNIKNRVSHYSGDVILMSKPGQGTSLEILLPDKQGFC